MANDAKDAAPNQRPPCRAVAAVALIAALPAVIAAPAAAEDVRLSAPPAVLEGLAACKTAVGTLPAFTEVPRAGVKVFYDSNAGKAVEAYWIVDWEGTRAFGSCTADGTAPPEVERFG